MFLFLFFIINLYEKSKGKMMPQQAGGSQPSRNPRKPRNTGQSPTSQPSPVQSGLSQPPSYQYQPSPQQPWTPPPPPPYQQTVHGQPTMPFYPQAGQQPPAGIKPTTKEKTRKWMCNRTWYYRSPFPLRWFQCSHSLTERSANSGRCHQ